MSRRYPSLSGPSRLRCPSFNKFRMSGGGNGGPDYRHSRVSGNPDGTEKTRPLPPNRRRIPAYAGMTVAGRQYRSIQTKILSILSIHV